MRWRHPEHGLLMPADFIPLVEQTALIGPLTLQMIDTALAQMVALAQAPGSTSRSPSTSRRGTCSIPTFRARSPPLLHRHEIPAERLTLEVTESATMIDPARAREVLCSLRDSGVSISIDDFGAGNASIGYLSSLPADELQDRPLVRERRLRGRAHRIDRRLDRRPRQAPRSARRGRGDRDRTR